MTGPGAAASFSNTMATPTRAVHGWYASRTRGTRARLASDGRWLTADGLSPLRRPSAGPVDTLGQAA